jgi:hypothetical protein
MTEKKTKVSLWNRVSSIRVICLILFVGGSVLAVLMRDMYTLLLCTTGVLVICLMGLAEILGSLGKLIGCVYDSNLLQIAQIQETLNDIQKRLEGMEVDSD